jgi:hypothetical protein
MRDRELYATILGVTAPWTVDRGDLDVAGGAVHVWLARTEGAPAQCPECQSPCTIYDHRDREWRHLDTCQLQTRLHARVPRVDCPTHGVLQSVVPWATPGSKFTLLFERLAIDWLREAAVTAVGRQLKLGWDAVWGIERRAVTRGLERRATLTLRYVGVDEKSFQRRHDYVTVASDLDEGRVLFVADDRKQESLEAFWALGLSAAQRTALEAIAMDMWAPYVQATRAQVPDADAKIVFDRFHCAKHLNEGVDRVPPRRAPGPPGAGRYPPDRHEVRLAAASRSLHAHGVARVRGTTHQHAQGRPRLGAQGDGGRPVGVSLRRRRPQILPSLVLLGDALPAAADDREGPDAQDPSPERAHVPAPPHHQRHRRGAQLDDPVDPLHRPRLPQPRELQDRDLLPLREARPLPTLKPEEPFFASLMRSPPFSRTRLFRAEPRQR